MVPAPHVLVVDDSIDTADSMAELLTHWGTMRPRAAGVRRLWRAPTTGRRRPSSSTRPCRG